MRKRTFSTFIISIIIVSVFGSGPALRTQESLNGKWTFICEKSSDTVTIDVPDYWDAMPGFSEVDEAQYIRNITIPDNEFWQNKTIKIDFEGVNFITDVYIDDKLVISHVGGWIPFSADISSFVKPGETHILKVAVKGGCYPPIVDANGAPQWPVGFFGQSKRWGIVFDVWLRTYGKAYIEDTYIKTSFRENKISVEHTVKNEFTTKKTFKIVSKIVSEVLPSKQELIFKSENFTLNPGETRLIKSQSNWETPRLWSPADPFLYYLNSELVEVKSGEIKPEDKETRRFGFREVWIEDNKIMFNGHRITMMGANIVIHSEFHETQRYYYMTPETWNNTIDRLMELNLRTVRFHMQPAPGYIIDIADERGLLIIDESTIYAREYLLTSNKEVYLANCKKWIEPWIKGRRNHPSIIVWNAENEMGVGWIKWLNNQELKSLGDAIRLFDKTRPVNYDGDADVGDQMVNYHYPETYKESVKGSIYSWADSVLPDKPCGVGEFITHYGENGDNNQWWQGTWVRGMRYVNFSDIRPYRHDWAINRTDCNEKIQNLINGFAPVALFDKEYDDLGIDPLIHKNYPFLKSGDTVTRKLILYNDEFADTIITVEVIIKSSQTYQSLFNYNGDRAPLPIIIAQGSKTYTLGLGEHADLTCTFQVPPIAEGFADGFEIEYITRKNGQVKFRESRNFILRNTEFKGTTSSVIKLGDLKKNY